MYGYATSTSVFIDGDISANPLNGFVAIALNNATYQDFTAAKGSSGANDPPSITATINPSDWIVVLGGNDRGDDFSDYSSGYTGIGINNNDVAVAAEYKTGISASSESPPAFTSTSGYWASFTIHVTPTS